MCLKEEKKKKPKQGEVEEGPTTTQTTTATSEAAASGETAAASLKGMTPDIVSGSGDMGDLDNSFVVLVIRDLSSAANSIPKETIFLSVSTTVANFFTEAGRVFRYEPNSFALTYQRSNGEQVELNDLPPEKCLGELGFTVGSSHWNNLILTNLQGMQPRRVEEDDLSLGASASPTSSVSERKMWYDVSPSNNSYEATPDAPSTTTRIKPDTVGYVGLVNQAMTCYLNSLLQTLFMTPEFRNALYRWEYKSTDEEASKSIPCQLQKLFLQLQTATRSAVETTNLTKSFGWDSSEVWQQHDIQELYRVMFDALEQCFKNTDQAELINNLYEGKMKDYVKCLECSTENAREDSFLDIPLPIRPFGSTTAYKSVEEALRAFVEPELLSGNNQYECAKCSAHCDAHKGLKFTRFPYLLTLHLKRFDFDYQTFHRIKLNDKVTFPNILDLNGFIEETCNKESAQAQRGAGAGAQVSSPDKCSAADKLDDASTTDSGSALDAEESSSVGFSASNQMSNDTDTQDEDEGIDVSSMYNEKNRLLCISNGPYVYELFSIMIHSGSASGGHYYAYIKDLKTGEWFCFNDQSVSRITYDDIRKTYGGPNARGYYSSWSSSANAYMLMYRQADKERNAEFFSQEEFPAHIKGLVQRMVTAEAAEREAREIERHMCKIKLFCQHPKARVLLEKKLKVHKDTTLKEATKLAYRELMLEEVVPLERCRLVKYEEVHDSIECSFENQENDPISEVLGGVRSSYKFDLLMEIRDENKEFEVYKPGGITVKVYTINLSTEEVEGPQTVRAAQTLTVREFKDLLGRAFSLDPEKMRIVQERYYNDHKPLLSDTKTLKEEGFYRSNKVYIEASGEEAPNFFSGSQMYSILVRYENTITLYCNLPERGPEVLSDLQIPAYNPKENEPSKQCRDPSPCPDVVMETEVTKEKSPSAVAPVQLKPKSSTSSSSSPPPPGGAAALTTDTTVTTSLPAGPAVTSSVPLISAPPPAAACSSSCQPAPPVTPPTQTKSPVTPTQTKSQVTPTPTTTPVTPPTPNKSQVTPTPTPVTPATPNKSPLIPPASTKSLVIPLFSTKALGTNTPTKLPVTPTPTKLPVTPPTPTKPSVTPPTPTKVPVTPPTPTKLPVTPTPTKVPVTTPTTTPVTPPTPTTIPVTPPTPTKPSVTPPPPTTPPKEAVPAAPSTKKKVKSPSKSKGGVSPTPAPSPQTPTAPVTCSSSDASAVVSLSDEDEGVGSSSTVNSDQSASEDSSLTSDSDRTLVGDPPEDNLSDNSPDYHNVSSPEDNAKDSEEKTEGQWDSNRQANDSVWGDEGEEENNAHNVKRYFRAHLTEPDVLRVSVDKRITIGQMKSELQKYVGVSEEHFKLYKYYVNSSHEFECTRTTETLTSYCDNNVMKIRLGRALLPGEFKGKVFMLDPTNAEDPSKFLIDFVVRNGESVAKVKNAIVKEVNAKCGMTLDPSKLRLRKKSWKNPQTIFLDHQLFDTDIVLYANCEYYLQVLDGPEEKTDNPDELSVFLKRFRPSSYSTDNLVEIILVKPTVEALKDKISSVSGIPSEKVEFAKGRGTFPCDMSVLEIPTELDWTPKTGSLDKRPISILDDGAVVYYKDSTETLKTLTELEKNELSNEENARLNRDYPSTTFTATPATTSRTREKGLKIYFNQTSSQ